MPTWVLVLHIAALVAGVYLLGAIMRHGLFWRLAPASLSILVDWLISTTAVVGRIWPVPIYRKLFTVQSHYYVVEMSLLLLWMVVDAWRNSHPLSRPCAIWIGVNTIFTVVGQVYGGMHPAFLYAHWRGLEITSGCLYFPEIAALRYAIARHFTPADNPEERARLMLAYIQTLPARQQKQLLGDCAAVAARSRFRVIPGGRPRPRRWPVGDTPGPENHA